MGKRKHPPISIHQTLNGTLPVNWSENYNHEFVCPLCNHGRLSHFYYDKTTLCQIQLSCEACHKSTPLSCQLRKSPPISIHQMLDGTLSVNWKTDYAGEFICPNCNQGKINNFHHSQKPISKLRLECDSCSQITNLTCEVPQHPPISIHQTLNGTLQVNWKADYAGEFICPQCNQGQLNRFSYSKGSVCKLRLGCDFCHQVTYLTGKFKHLPISIHQTLQGTLSVNWAEKYSGEFICPQCNQGQISKFHYADGQSHQLKLGCNSCSLKTLLCCQVPPQFHGYQKHLVCPNPLCHQIGPDGQKGWIYETFQTNSSQSNCRCYFCHINFHPNATSYGSWVGYQQEETLLNFCFDDDVWDFRHFINNSPVRILNFKSIKPEWFRVLVKQYLYSLLKSGRFSASAKPMNSLVALRQFSQILKPNNIHHLPEISRELILAFLDLNQSNCSRTIREKLYNLKDFFDFFGLESQNLVRHRDIPKQIIQDVDWLDEITRQGIKQHLGKIPAPVARHYLVQEYTAARPADICQIAFDCLVEENGQWYIKFYQHKVERWHRLPAPREIRQVIEQQQQWIRKTFDSDYPYLFCHFRSIKQSSYPSFPSLKPLPKPPQVTADENPMVRLIRLLIEREDIRDSNGIKPYFTGKITRASRLQEVRAKHGMEAAQLYADHLSSETTFQHYAPPTKEQVAVVDLPFQELLLNSQNRFLPWQSLPESLLKNPSSHELDLEISPRLVVYGHCTLDPKTNCIYNLYPKCYGCGSFRPSTSKLPLYERQYAGEHKRMESAKQGGAALAYEESKATLEAMDKWLSDLRKVANGEAT
ncbi:integrase [Nostoc sp. UHCC 0251]|uniref:integrase n=1 Tax=Nostoc sp. UHCC 0251 TaxID=3110240 RepID=UPI002B2048DB|nr:integrase [Nostoc sp. UHCC 0251]MEA5622131.1 integrase [Nostoc sp. UHCC 0251]